MPCDRHFGNTELKLRKHANILNKEEYISHIRDATVDGFNVVEMQQSDFLDFDVLQKHITRTAKDMNFSDARILLFDVVSKEGVSMKRTYEDDAEAHKVRLMQGRKGYSRQAFYLSVVQLPAKYREPIKLNPKKLKELHVLVHYIAPPSKAQYYYEIFRQQDLLTNAHATAASDEEDEEDHLQEYDV